MLAKVSQECSFSHAVEYDMGLTKDRSVAPAVLMMENLLPSGVDSSGHYLCDAESLTAQFEIQASIHPMDKPAGRIILSFEPDNEPRLKDDFTRQLIEEFLQRMRILHVTQWMATRHYDTDNPHVHIIYNHVKSDGSRLDNFHSIIRARDIAYSMTSTRLLVPGNSTMVSKVVPPIESERYRYLMASKAKEAIDATVKSLGPMKWDDDEKKYLMEFRRQCEERGMTNRFYVMGKNVYGISFCYKDDKEREHKFAAKSLDPLLTAPNIINAFEGRSLMATKEEKSRSVSRRIEIQLYMKREIIDASESVSNMKEFELALRYKGIHVTQHLERKTKKLRGLSYSYTSLEGMKHYYKGCTLGERCTAQAVLRRIPRNSPSAVQAWRRKIEEHQRVYQSYSRLPWQTEEQHKERLRLDEELRLSRRRRRGIHR